MTNASILVGVMFAHVALTALLYAALTLARAPRVWRFGSDSPTLQALETRISANLSNQFEWPLFFHVACLLILQSGSVTGAQVLLAVLFLVGRVLHSGVQILTTNIRARGLIFTINFLAVIALWFSYVL